MGCHTRLSELLADLQDACLLPLQAPAHEPQQPAVQPLAAAAHTPAYPAAQHAAEAPPAADPLSSLAAGGSSGGGGAASAYARPPGGQPPSPPLAAALGGAPLRPVTPRSDSSEITSDDANWLRGAGPAGAAPAMRITVTDPVKRMSVSARVGLMSCCCGGGGGGGGRGCLLVVVVLVGLLRHVCAGCMSLLTCCDTRCACAGGTGAARAEHPLPPSSSVLPGHQTWLGMAHPHIPLFARPLTP